MKNKKLSRKQQRIKIIRSMRKFGDFDKKKVNTLKKLLP